MRNFPAYVVSNPWLASILGREVFKVNLALDCEHSRFPTISGVYDLHECLRKRPVFLYTKVPSDEFRTIRSLETTGFHLVDNNIFFEKNIIIPKESLEDSSVRFSLLEDKYKVMEIARTSFVYSRFHMDEMIPKSTADTIKAEWAGNYYHGKRGDNMVVAVDGGEITGFLQLLYQGKTLVIDLIAVSEKHRRKGMARKMITFAEVALSGFEIIRVGTQVANVPSMRLYEGMGFRVTGSSYAFHYHKV